MPRTTLLGAPAGLAVTDLGPLPPSRSVGYVTTPEPAATAAVRALIRELRAGPLPEGLVAARPVQSSSDSRSVRNSAASASSV
ncbi:hypothetical protein ACFVSN_33545 [Kitasatospora sp. NPDC057904]|uniref:hypothetical protein n=1 Tax=Kitasatospora sp. NPDC057904 TaxID=3346275 RepID=UPI0036DDD52E